MRKRFVGRELAVGGAIEGALGTPVCESDQLVVRIGPFGALEILDRLAPNEVNLVVGCSLVSVSGLGLGRVVGRLVARCAVVTEVGLELGFDCF